MALTMCSHLDNYQIVIWRQNQQLYYQTMGHQTKGECQKVLKGHTNDVISLVVLLNGHLASGSYDLTQDQTMGHRHLRV